LHCFAQRGDVFAMVKGQAWKMQHVVLSLSRVSLWLDGWMAGWDDSAE
jgi:hypothetical protein